MQVILGYLLYITICATWKKKMLCGGVINVLFFSVLSKTHRNDKILILRGFNFVIKSVNLLTESALESCRLMEFNRNINFYLDHLKHLTSKDIFKNAFNDCILKV